VLGDVAARVPVFINRLGSGPISAKNGPIGSAEIFENGPTVTGEPEMRPFYDEFDDFDFGDDDVVSKIMREQEREERRLASKRRRGSTKKQRHEAFEPQDDFSDDDDFEVYDDYDDEEFDTYSGLDLDR
jgi:hypothetical protein